MSRRVGAAAAFLQNADEMSRATPIIAPDRPDDAVLRYVRELAEQLAREDHAAEIAGRRPASQPEAAE